MYLLEKDDRVNENVVNVIKYYLEGNYILDRLISGLWKPMFEY